LRAKVNSYLIRNVELTRKAESFLWSIDKGLSEQSQRKLFSFNPT